MTTTAPVGSSRAVCRRLRRGEATRCSGLCRSSMALRRIVVLVAAVLFLLAPAAAIPEPADVQTAVVQTAWRLLDYIAVDYGGAVSGGQVKSATEFAEMNEFAASVSTRLAALPPTAARERLLDGAAQLRSVVASKGSQEQVAALARGLAVDLLKTYPVPLAPTKAPEFSRGETSFAQNCANCHGIAGDGHGPGAAKLSTPPIAFTDLERARQRSVFALYQVIGQGIDGTAMQSFAALPDEDRWALAFYVGHFAFSDESARDGERHWKADADLRKQIPDLTTLVGLTPEALAKSVGAAVADETVAYLRRHPDTCAEHGVEPLAVARAKLSQSLVAYRGSNREDAGAFALAAYLDGIEPIEPMLTTRHGTLMGRVESEMGELRAAIQHGSSATEVADRVETLNELFDDVETVLAPDTADSTSTFFGAFTILLREGLEALLIVVAMIAFLRKADRSEVLPYVHAGWIGALLAGVATWAVATYAIGISGASRELTEGFGSLFAAVVLLSVGIWMHGKSQADQWQRYIGEKMSRALSGRTSWFLFGLAFIVVYREVFETILFYAALWTQGNGGVLLAGASSAVLLLAAIAWVMLRLSRRLPVAEFFSYSAWLMAILTVVLAGKGVAGLQEAGIVGIAPLHAVPRLPMFGVFPTVQSISTQAVMLLGALLGFDFNRRRAVSPT